jgi:hypothetical protein
VSPVLHKYAALGKDQEDLYIAEMLAGTRRWDSELSDDELLTGIIVQNSLP